VLGAPKTPTVNLTYYTDQSSMKVDVQKGGIDVASRSLSATDIADPKKDSAVKVTTGAGGEIRYVVFNFDTQPFGAEAGGANAEKAVAVRQATAALLISHDLAVVDILADRIAVPYRGELVEEGTGAEVLGAPKPPYTKRLLASLPVPNRAKQALRREELRREELRCEELRRVDLRREELRMLRARD